MQTGLTARHIKNTSKNKKIRETAFVNRASLFLTDHKQSAGLLYNRGYKGGMISRAIFDGVKITRVCLTVKKVIVDWLIIKNKHKLLI